MKNMNRKKTEVALTLKPTDLSESDYNFSKYVKSKQKTTMNPQTGKHWTTQELAKALGFEYERFRKVVNMSKPTKKRDVIIAICIKLTMSVIETNKALNLYSSMPALDSAIVRDCVFIEILEQSQGASLSIDDINSLLKIQGCNGLDLHKQIYNKVAKPVVHYTPIKRTIRILTDGIIWGPEYVSFSSQYQPNDYRCMASTLLEERSSKRRLIATVDLSVDNYTYRIERNLDGISRKYDTQTDGSELVPFYNEIHLAAKGELDRLLKILDDSRNYRLRTDAQFKDNGIHIYLETFNYRIPELEEYCFLEHYDNVYRLYVYNHSEFMYHHLGPEKYERVFGKREHSSMQVFNSLEELSNTISDLPDILDRTKYSVWKTIYSELITEADMAAEDLKDRRTFIQNIDELDDSDIHICEYYKVSNDFGYAKDPDGLFRPAHTNAEFKLADLPSTSLTIEELRRAYQLGIPDVESICRFKMTSSDFGAFM